MESKTIVLITGANQGVGYETAKNLLLTSPTYHILLGTRDLGKGQEALSTLTVLPIQGTVEAIQIDVTSTASITQASSLISSKHGRLDVLVNNAGIFSKNPTKHEALREELEVNCIGAVAVTEAFLPLLKKSLAPRLVFVSSSTGSLTMAADPESALFHRAVTTYRATKSALNMCMILYHNTLSPSNIKVFGADPGLVITNLVDKETQRKRGGVEGHVGGERIATIVKGERDADVGKLCGVYGVCAW